MSPPMHDPALVLAIIDVIPEFVDPEVRAWWEAQLVVQQRARQLGGGRFIASLPAYLRLKTRAQPRPLTLTTPLLPLHCPPA